MKKYIALGILGLMSLSTFAQGIDTRRKVEVVGTAETEVTPDILYVAVSLREYLRDNNSKKKVEITELEKQLYASVQNAGIPKENITISNVSASTDYWNKKKNAEFLASKQYMIKVTDLNKYNKLMSGIDAKGVQSTYIQKYDYSKMESVKKDLRIKAVLDAKQRAASLAGALNNNLGNVLSIIENDGGGYSPVMYETSRMMKAQSASDAADSAPEIDFKKITLRTQVNVVFELK